MVLRLAMYNRLTVSVLGEAVGCCCFPLRVVAFDIYRKAVTDVRYELSVYFEQSSSTLRREATRWRQSI